MNLEVSEQGNLVFREVFNSVVFKTLGSEGDEPETLAICMRDSGFEFVYQGVWYEAKCGAVRELGEASG